jgi:hypothetical protein
VGKRDIRKAAPNRVGNRLDEKVQSASALDFASDLAVEPGGNPCHTTRQQFACFGTETGEQLRVLVVKEFEGHVQAPTREAAIGTAQVHSALWGFRLHKLS